MLTNGWQIMIFIICGQIVFGFPYNHGCTTLPIIFDLANTWVTFEKQLSQNTKFPPHAPLCLDYKSETWLHPPSLCLRFSLHMLAWLNPDILCVLGTSPDSSPPFLPSPLLTILIIEITYRNELTPNAPNMHVGNSTMRMVGLFHYPYC